MLKKTIFIIGIAFCLIQIPVFSENSAEIHNQNAVQVEQNLEDTTDYSEEQSVTTTPMTGEIDSMVKKSPYENNFQEKVPEQNEFTRAIFLFLKTMFAVGISSIIIFLLLLGIRKFYGTPSSKIQANNEIEDNLKSTQNENEALQIFFNKTKNL